jgi:NitT/TauT family transport system permease protein
MSVEAIRPGVRVGTGGRANDVVRKVWSVTWPKLLAVGIALGVWELVFLSRWKPDFLLPSPVTTLSTLKEIVTENIFWREVQTTMQRGIIGFFFALLIGSALGIAVSQWRVLRVGVGSMVTGLQTMPSIAWFPLAILLFGLRESAIMFVIILGAAPSIANGIISGIDEVPPSLLRAGHMLGARGVNRYRHVVLPAALPSYISGLKQGWAFAWRSLMAGELLVLIPDHPSLGGALSLARTSLQADRLLAFMIVILIIGMLIDAVFSSLSKFVRERRGLTGL